MRVSRADSVEELKKAVAKKLKVLKDRICLLYRERWVTFPFKEVFRINMYLVFCLFLDRAKPKSPKSRLSP